MTDHRSNRVVYQPETYRRLLRGAQTLVAAVRPTLGPRPRQVAVERIASRSQTPELLDNAATIGRRLMELADREADMGAMLVRHLLWRQTERHGDGAATAAVLFEAVLKAGVRYVVGGGNAMALRRGLTAGMEVVLGELTRLARPVAGKEQLAQVALTACHDPELAQLLGEIFDIIGEHGFLDIRPGQGRGLEREYVEGLYWDGGLHSRRMLPAGQLRVETENAAILISDLAFENPEDLAPTLRAAAEAGCGGLIIVATRIWDPVAALCHVNTMPGKFQVIAVKAPGGDLTQRAETLNDMALLTGGRVFVETAGGLPKALDAGDLGRARRGWANLDYFGFVSGRGDPRALRRHIADLRAALQAARTIESREHIQTRIGKLLGGTAILHVGGLHEIELNARKEAAERAAKVVRSALHAGVLPGGGAALLACQTALRQGWRAATDTDSRAAYQILLTACEAPLRTLIANGGGDVSHVLAEIRQAEPGWGYDVESGRIADMDAAGIVDAAAVQQTASANAISTAALALTVDVLVYHRAPQKEFST